MSMIIIGFTDQHSLLRCEMFETSRQASVEGSHAWLDSDCLAGWMQITGYSHHLAHHHCFWQAWRWRLLHTLHTLYYHMLNAVLHCYTRHITAGYITQRCGWCSALWSRDPNQQSISNVNHSMTELCRCDSKLFQWTSAICMVTENARDKSVAWPRNCDTWLFTFSFAQSSALWWRHVYCVLYRRWTNQNAGWRCSSGDLEVSHIVRLSLPTPPLPACPHLTMTTDVWDKVDVTEWWWRRGKWGAGGLNSWVIMRDNCLIMLWSARLITRTRW